MNTVPEPAVARSLMIERLLDGGDLELSVLRAMGEVAREIFMPAGYESRAYDDQPWPIGHGQTISQPTMIARMTSVLDVRPNHRVLDVGTGSGYHAAVLSRLAAEVFSIERVKPLLDGAFERLAAVGARNVRLRLGDGSVGWPEAAPFDRIIVAAGAPDVPRALIEQLADDGVLVLPVGTHEDQQLMRITKSNGEVVGAVLDGCRFVPLIGKAGWPA